MLIRYARVSSIGRNVDTQMDALKKVGCKKYLWRRNHELVLI